MRISTAHLSQEAQQCSGYWRHRTTTWLKSFLFQKNTLPIFLNNFFRPSARTSYTSPTSFPQALLSLSQPSLNAQDALFLHSFHAMQQVRWNDKGGTETGNKNDRRGEKKKGTTRQRQLWVDGKRKSGKATTAVNIVWHISVSFFFLRN